MTPAPLYPDWPSVLEAGPQTVGGKAWTLARLARHQFDVPAGMAIPVAPWQHWMATAGASEALLAAAALPPSQRAQALVGPRAVLRAQPLPAMLIDALDRALATAPWAGAALAVRSSAPQEDSAQASFAGIHRSVLNVIGRDALHAALREVWLSPWTEAAIAYRERLGLPHAEAAMAVLLMPLVPALASGIAFTCDPASGREDRLLIHANWGLGESLVGGEAAGDEAVLGLDPGDDGLVLLAHRIGSKALASRARPGGGTECLATAAAEATRPALAPAQLLALGNALRLAAHTLADVGQPLDFEWAWDGQRFQVLQARPVTARARCTYPELRSQPDLWSRGNTKDVLPHPLSPAEWAAVPPLCNAMLMSGLRLTDARLQPGVQRAAVIHGRMYLNMAVIQWELFSAFGVSPATINHFAGGHQPEITVPAVTPAQRRRHLLNKLRYVLRAAAVRRRGRHEMQAAIDQMRAWRSRPLPQADADIAAALRALIRNGRSREGMQFLQGSGAAGLTALVEMIDAHLPGRGHALASALMAGGPPSVSAQQGYDLAELARLAMHDAAASAWLARRATQPGDADWRQLPPDNPWRNAFSRFLDRYGHRAINETYLRQPRWHEDPGYLLDNLPALAEVDLGALAARQRALAREALRTVRTALPWHQRPVLHLALRMAKRESNQREAARSAFIADVEPLRRLGLALGARWVQRGWLAAPEHILLLMPVETLAVLDGERPGAALRTLVAERAGRLAEWQAVEAPDVISRGPADGGAAPPAVPPSAAVDARQPNSGNAWHGVAVGGGLASGPVRLIRSPEHGHRLAPGDILVAPSTDPAWTPLFLRAAGLVMETGGFMSHGAIVAREFGIPAVVNIPGVMAVLREGERVEIDGRAGTLRRMS